MIPVTLANEPPSFDAHVRQRGQTAIQRLLGQPVHVPGRKPKNTYSSLSAIPTSQFPDYWTEVREEDGKSTLDDMMDAYHQLCAYLGMRLERATGSPTVDHYISQKRNRNLIYEWSNYRLSANCVNGTKGEKEVIDPFQVQVGWFHLDLDTFLVCRGSIAPPTEHARIDETLPILNLRQCIAQRCDYITGYREGELTIREVQRYAPFIASEFRRQGKLRPGDT